MAANGSSATTSCRRCRGGSSRSRTGCSATDAAYYALAQACVVIAFALVFATARPLVGAVGALIAVLIIDGMHYFQYTAVKFNHDVVQLPFWALAGYAFHAALKRGRLGHWVLLGVAFGGALWAKYFVVVLAVPYALFMLFDRQARRALATPGPWLALVVALIIASPHVVWLFHTDFLPFAYAEPSGHARCAAGSITFCIRRCSRRARSSSCCRRCSSPRRCSGRSRNPSPSTAGADVADPSIAAS